MLKTASSSLIWRGILAIIIGMVSVAWPQVTVGAFVFLFAAYAFVAAVIDFSRAFNSDRAGPVIGFVLLALLSIAAGIAALLWPGITALSLTILVAAWAFVTGVAEVTLAFGRGEGAGERAMWAIGGLVSIAFGVVLAIRPDIGAVTLALLFGLFSVAFGISAIAMGVMARRAGQSAEKVVHPGTIPHTNPS
ncbi:DUF308 domain-containing protein [Streptosporangium sp. NPDC051022]|uniref:HdeD family acid-resistance protein n=1 Tax=Streptosporangium sp. NPDC051022 TaxID=3155752 RepID=UPI00344309ED